MPKPSRRSDALSKERIVDAARQILDTDGEKALTVRALAAHLQTGAGAIYWHVDGKSELLAVATGDVIAEVMAEIAVNGEPRDAILSVASSVFDAMDRHPWLGAELAREPWQPAVTQLFEGIGGRLDALGVPERAQFDAATAIISFILGLANQHAARARLLPGERSRDEFLGSIADRWNELDPQQYPFLQRMTAQLRDHDDREQFLAGIDFILAGIVATSATE